MSTEMLSFDNKSEQRKGRLELPVFKLDRRLTLFNQGEDDKRLTTNIQISKLAS